MDYIHSVYTIATLYPGLFFILFPKGIKYQFVQVFTFF